MAALLVLAFTQATASFGPTFGNGLAGVPVCGPEHPASVIVNYTLPVGKTHGVLHHFWTTGGGESNDLMWVDYFIDGEATPSISFQPAMMCGLMFPHLLAPATKEYAAGALCGKNSPSGGWFNTFPIPFYTSAVVRMRRTEKGCTGAYANVRGTVELPLVIPGSGISLGVATGLKPRLWLQKNALALHQPLEYITVAQLDPGMSGFVLQTSWGVQTDPVGGSKNGGGYIEGCWTFYRKHNESFPGLVVGTGVEDYFDSAYYFGADAGQPIGIPFATPLSGLPLFTRDGKTETLSAYRFHNRDPLVMEDGGRLVWRVGAAGTKGSTKCGNPIPPSGRATVRADGTLEVVPAADYIWKSETVGEGLARTLSAVQVTTYAWVYTFDGVQSEPGGLPTVAPTAPPSAPVPSPDSGCADGSCDGLCGVKNVRGCSAEWKGVADMRSPRSAPAPATACGDGVPCAVPADACAVGWALCVASNASTGSSSLAAYSAAITPAQCNSASNDGAFIGAMSHANGVGKTCTTGTQNGCHGSWGGEPICCGSSCVKPSCPDGVWKGATEIIINDGPSGVCSSIATAGTTIKGVLCCRV